MKTNYLPTFIKDFIALILALGLRHRGLDVTSTPDENLLGVSDEIQLQLALSYKQNLWIL